MKRSLRLPKERVITIAAFPWKRAVAFLIDIIIVSIIVNPLEKVITKSVGASSYGEIYAKLVDSSQFGNLIIAISIFMSIVAILYFSVLEYKFGQTIGKIIMNIYVVSEDKILKYWQCIVRNLFLLPFIPFIVLWLVDPLYVLFTPERRRLSDIFSKTKVVEYYKG